MKERMTDNILNTNNLNNKFMEKIYTEIELKSPNAFQRLFKRSPKENSFVEINNLLAIKPIKEIKVEHVAEIVEKYKVDLRRLFLNRLKELYERYLKICFEDNVLTEDEIDNLNHLKSILMLNTDEVTALHNALGGAIYRNNIDEAIKDGIFDENKQAFLNKLKQNLQLPDAIAEKISQESRTQLVKDKVDAISEDNRISPEEWEELNLLAKNLDVNLTMDDKSKAVLEKMKLFWIIENGDLPVKQVEINLQKNEKCYYSSYAEWYENRTVTKRINYSGPSYRIKIMKGLYYRVGSIKPRRITMEQLQQIDLGVVYITNKRIIFMGNKKNTNILFSKILFIVPYHDGIEIEKSTGKSPILKVFNNADILAMIISRIMNDLQNNN
jgi:hypothetical protein